MIPKHEIRWDNTCWKRSIIIVEEFLAIERNKTLENAISNTASSNGANDFAFQIKGVSSNVGHLPVTALNHLTCD